MDISNIQLDQCHLRFISKTDFDFIHDLFSDKEISKYYILREDHSADLHLFLEYLINSLNDGYALNYIILDESNSKIGIITVELTKIFNKEMWSIAYAIHPNHRRKGFATSALSGVTKLLSNSSFIEFAILDICVDNIYSEKVAFKCGYSHRKDLAYNDLAHPDMNLRYKWIKPLIGKRIIYFNQALQASRDKKHKEALELLQKSIKEEYQPNSPQTDAQIYSNMGMCYSSMGQYEKAFICLVKAQTLGLTNTQITNELIWLKKNAGIS